MTAQLYAICRMPPTYIYIITTYVKMMMFKHEW